MSETDFTLRLQAEQERDRLKAENEKLREALTDFCTAGGELSSNQRWMRLEIGVVTYEEALKLLGLGEVK